MDWLQIIVTRNAEGQEEVHANYSPEDFVKELQRRQETLVVAESLCCECFATPACPLPREAIVSASHKDLDVYHRFLECLCVTVARRSIYHSTYGIPSLVLCASFYEEYKDRNPYLQAATQAGLITRYPVKNLPGLKASGLHICQNHEGKIIG